MTYDKNQQGIKTELKGQRHLEKRVLLVLRNSALRILLGLALSLLCGGLNGGPVSRGGCLGLVLRGRLRFRLSDELFGLQGSDTAGSCVLLVHIP